MKHTITGHWRIIWMEEWDQDYIDLVDPGFIKISSDGSGEFLFGVVSGGFHINPNAVHFHSNWEGSMECDEARGSIDGNINQDGKLVGSISFWDGDESEYQAIKENI